MATEITNEKLNSLFVNLQSIEYDKWFNISVERSDLIKILIDECLPDMMEFSLDETHGKLIRRKDFSKMYEPERKSEPPPLEMKVVEAAQPTKKAKTPPETKPETKVQETVIDFFTPDFDKCISDFEDTKPVKKVDSNVIYAHEI